MNAATRNGKQKMLQTLEDVMTVALCRVNSRTVVDLVLDRLPPSPEKHFHWINRLTSLN
jgi:hypothetical protein